MLEGKQFLKKTLFVWIPQGALSPLLPLPRWGWTACAGHKGPQKYLSGLFSAEKNLSKVPSHKALALTEKQGLLGRKCTPSAWVKGLASACKLKFLGVSPSPLSQVQITSKQNKLVEGIRLSYLSYQTQGQNMWPILSLQTLCETHQSLQWVNGFP